jgi:hypothetical protein
MTDYDSPWKTLLQRFFPAFTGVFLPGGSCRNELVAGFTFLDKELQKVVRDATLLGRRWADSLVRVTGLDGAEDWVLVHNIRKGHVRHANPLMQRQSQIKSGNRPASGGGVNRVLDPVRCKPGASVS